MSEEKPEESAPKSLNPEWFLRGALTRIGDTVDRLTGRRWVPAGSLATSGLIERLKTLIDSEARENAEKGMIVPHHVTLKMQWDKFSTDNDESLDKLRNELLIAATDHINDQQYYTLAPLTLDVKRDYFTEGVKLFVSFDELAEDAHDAELNVTIPLMKIEELTGTPASLLELEPIGGFTAHYTIGGVEKTYSFSLKPRDRISVGRIGSNDLVLDDPSVSKMHASVVADAEGNLSVADTGSTNGTFINDQRISYGLATKLEDHDRVKFGEIEVTFDRSEEIADKATVEMTDAEFGQHSPLAEDTLKLEPEEPNPAK